MSTPGAAVDLMFEYCFKVDFPPQLNAIPNILYINKLVEAIAQVATILKTRMWGGSHGCLALVLEDSKMHHVANEPAFNCDHMKEPPFTHPDITTLTTVTKDNQFTNNHKVTWDEYHLQEDVIFHGRATIVASVIHQYIEEKEVDNLSYGNKTILLLVAHI